MIKTIDNLTSNFTASCEVCVIGSGAGGAVIARELAQAGIEVIVLEEGGYHPTSSFSHDPQRMLPKLYRHAGGSVIWGNTPILYAEGRCVGGSTVINAGICFRAPDNVLEKWSSEFGLTDFTPERLAPYFEKVEHGLHVQPVPDEALGKDSLKMELAAKNLNYSYVRVRRNIHACQGTNLCIMGCPTGAKQSTLVSYLPQAFKHGARLYANCRAEKILVHNGRTCGVEVSVIDPSTNSPRYRGTIRAHAVFVCGGALQTPALLFRSKLALRRSAVGRNLYVHPNTKLVGIFDEAMKSWQGSIQGFQIDEFADEGFTFGSTFLPPGILALTLPFSGNGGFKLMEYYNHMSVWGVLMEDSHAGRVQHLLRGRTAAIYFITKDDRQRLMRGVRLLARLFFAAGARAVLLPTREAPELHNEDEVAAFFQNEKRSRSLSLFTVHLMGTCRIGRDSRTSVINADHEYHGVRNLFIADASVFPSPIRVNPMITIMALATRAAERFVENKRKY
jgi:choline dehydrogenase-like flavoprotein